ncbi:MAG: hypothetical protein AB1Z98_07620 [Nannocystaceae bacterium]
MIIAPLPVLLLAAVSSPSEAPSGAAGSTNAVASVSRVRLEIDHDGLLSNQPAFAAKGSADYVRQDGVKALREQLEVDVVDDDAAPKIIVALAWKDYDKSVYQIEVSTQRTGHEVELVEAFEAKCINDAALTEVILAKLPAALEQLEAPTEAPTPPPAETPVDSASSETTDDGSHDAVDESSKRPSLGMLGKVGLGLGIPGVVGLGVGIGVFVQGERFEDDPSGQQPTPDGRDYQPPGLALMISGGVLAATGVTLLVVDRVRAKKKRSDVAQVWLSPTGNGIAVAGRF